MTHSVSLDALGSECATSPGPPAGPGRTVCPTERTSFVLVVVAVLGSLGAPCSDTPGTFAPCDAVSFGFSPWHPPRSAETPTKHTQKRLKLKQPSQMVTQTTIQVSKRRLPMQVAPTIKL